MMTFRITLADEHFHAFEIVAASQDAAIEAAAAIAEEAEDRRLRELAGAFRDVAHCVEVCQ